MSNLDRINAAQNVSRLDPFKNQNEFDYSAWNGKEAQIKLLSVTWESDYKNAVNWQKYGVEGRDAWFQKEHEDELNITTGWNFKRAMQWSPSEQKFIGEISVPEPIENVRHYNYLYLQDYSKPVPFNTGKKVTDFFYFITAANADSANKTTLYLSVDAWTMFFHEANIVAVNLERGHWGHKQITAEEFLENPLDAPVDLTVHEEGLPSVKPMVSYTNLLSLTESEPRVCIATTAAFEDNGLSEQWVPGTTTWGDPFAGNFDFSLPFHETWTPGDEVSDNADHAIPSPSTGQYSAQGSTASSTRVYSTDLNTFERFINTARSTMPQIFETIKAFYILPSALIDEGEEFPLSTLEGVTGSDMLFKSVKPQPQAQKLADVEITNEIFDYGDELSQFAKAYTSQFAQLKISDFSGNAAVLGVEELAGNLEFYGRASSTFPFLKVQAFLNGIGGSTEKTYAINPLTEMNAQGFNSKWTEFLWNLDIPTFTVDVAQKDLNTAYSMDSWMTAIENADIDAKNAMIDADYAEKSSRDILEQEILEHDERYAARERNIEHEYAIEGDRISHEKTMAERDRDTSYADLTGIDYLSNHKQHEIEENSIDEYIQRSYNYLEKENIEFHVIHDLEYLNRERLYTHARTMEGRMASMQSLNDTKSVDARVEIASRTISTESNVDKLNIQHAYNEAYENGRAANKTHEFNLFGNRIEEMLGVSGSMLSIASTATGSVVGGAIAGSAMPGLGTVVGAAGGLLASGVSVVSGLANVDIEEGGYELQRLRAVVDTTLNTGWAEVIEGNGIILSYPGLPEAVNIPPGTKSLLKNLTEMRRDHDTQVEGIKKNLSELNMETEEDKDRWIIENTRDMQLDGADLTFDNEAQMALDDYEVRGFSADEMMEENMNFLDSEVRDRVFNNDESLSLAESVRGIRFDKSTADIASIFNHNTSINELSRTLSLLNMNSEKAVTETGHDLRDALIERSYDDAYEKINNDYSKFRKSLIAETNRARQGAPISYGASSTDDPNAFGQWGLEVSVERISKAAERDVADTFLKYGYSMPGTLVTNPVLGQMSDFTYWQCRDAWIVSPQLADSLALIIKSMFIEGVTLWEDPDNVRLTDIEENN